MYAGITKGAKENEETIYPRQREKREGYEGKEEQRPSRWLAAIQLAIRSYDQMRWRTKERKVQNKESQLSLTHPEKGERTEVQSPDPVATIPPTGETATEMTEFLCP